MTRVLSGVVLGAVFLALIWFLSSIALLGVALDYLEAPAAVRQ